MPLISAWWTMPDTASMAARPFWISASSANQTYMLGYGKGDVLNAMLKKFEILEIRLPPGFWVQNEFV